MEQYGQFGYNYYGEMGINSRNTGSGASNQGLKVARQAISADLVGILNKVTQLVTGGYHTVIRTEEKKAYVWGYNGEYQLATGDTTPRTYPVELLDGTSDEPIKNVKYIGAGQKQTMVVLTNGEYYVSRKKLKISTSTR